MEKITVKELVAATNGKLLCGDENIPVKWLSINSKEVKRDSLFVPLIGDKVDAHQYIQQALEAGAVAVLTSRHQQMEADQAWVYVADTRTALQAIGRFLREQIKIPLIGVTGSVGKTTTRQMIAAALAAEYSVFQTPKNYNGQLGVPITLSEISGLDQIGVIEMGMSEPGEMTVISHIAKVDAAVITNIGVAHLEQLKTKANILTEKLAIQRGMKSDGVLFLHGDDEYLRDVKAKTGCQTIFYGTNESCDYRAVDIEITEGRPAFTVIYKNEKIRVHLNIRGKHFIENALAALAVAHHYGVSLNKAAQSLEQLSEFESRQKVYHHNGIIMIDDAYNASPVSMKAGLEVLNSMNGAKRKIAVLADMKELGTGEKEFHREIGAYIVKHPVDIVMTLGELAKEISSEIRKHTDQIFVYQFNDIEALTQYLKMVLVSGDCVLLKGSNSMKLSTITKELVPEG